MKINEEAAQFYKDLKYFDKCLLWSLEGVMLVGGMNE